VMSLGMGSAGSRGGRRRGGGGKMICQVPGCGKELAGLKDYHQRYRICALHIKLPQVRPKAVSPAAAPLPSASVK